MRLILPISLRIFLVPSSQGRTPSGLLLSHLRIPATAGLQTSPPLTYVIPRPRSAILRFPPRAHRPARAPILPQPSCSLSPTASTLPPLYVTRFPPFFLQSCTNFECEYNSIYYVATRVRECQGTARRPPTPPQSTKRLRTGTWNARRHFGHPTATISLSA